ncbi:MAG: BtpA/SgcQ family protein [Candidatus Melainabacteria bacterium]
MIVTETFQNPKPVLATLRLLPLPGACRWGGQMEPVLARAEQEALALASGGVDGILIENEYETPLTHQALDTAGVIAMASIVGRVSRMTGLPVGISVLPNDIRAALAIALNKPVAFIRVPLLLGVQMTEFGVVNGCLAELLARQAAMRLPRLPLILADIATSHEIGPNRLPPAMSDDERLTHLRQLASRIASYQLAGALSVHSEDIPEPAMLAELAQDIPLPLFVRASGADARCDALYNAAKGLVLTGGMNRAVSADPSLPPGVDMIRVETLVHRLRGAETIESLGPDYFLAQPLPRM